MLSTYSRLEEALRFAMPTLLPSTDRFEPAHEHKCRLVTEATALAVPLARAFGGPSAVTSLPVLPFVLPVPLALPFPAFPTVLALLVLLLLALLAAPPVRAAPALLLAALLALLPPVALLTSDPCDETDIDSDAEGEISSLTKEFSAKS